MKLVEMKNLQKSFGNNKAVNNINLEIEEGQIYGLLGPNGAGKSTIINMICGLLSPDKGEIFILGEKMNKKARGVKSNIGIVPQDIAIYEDLTAYENVAFFASLYGLKGKKLKDKVKESLEFVGLKDKGKEYPSRFSGGMKRRINIACAIAHEPKLIIMDEPTVGIDPQSRNHILESIKRLNEGGCTIIYTSHYMEEVEHICTNIAIVDKGKIIAEGEKSELIQKYTDHSTIIINVEKSKDVEVDKIKSIHGVSDVNIQEKSVIIQEKSSQDNLAEIIKYFMENGIKIKSIENKNNDLEHIFLSLTGKKLRD